MVTGSVFTGSDWVAPSLEVSSTSNCRELGEAGPLGTNATVPCWEERTIIQEKEQGFGNWSFKSDFKPMSDMGRWVSKWIGRWEAGQMGGGGAGQKLHG